LTGATSPVTIAGTLVQHVAENLSGLTICQVAAKGAPVIFGGSPASFDMRKGTTPMGAVETMMIDSAYAQIAIDDGICAMVYRLLAGIAQRDDPIALGLFEGFAPDMQFLSLPHTRQWYRKEHILAGLVDRDPYEAWVTAGRTSIVDKAHADVRRRLEEYDASPLADPVRKEMDKIMAAYARSQGVGRLPVWNF
jgi:trimethylamine:corrinoid methyltransferase-like protein